MPRTTEAPEPAADRDVLAEGGAPESASEGQPASITETVASTAGGVLIAGASLWFLAPICFTC